MIYSIKLNSLSLLVILHLVVGLSALSEFSVDTCSGVGARLSCNVCHKYSGLLDTSEMLVFQESHFMYQSTKMSVDSPLTFAYSLDSFRLATAGASFKYNEASAILLSRDCNDHVSGLPLFDQCGSWYDAAKSFWGGFMPDWSARIDYCGNLMRSQPFVCFYQSGVGNGLERFDFYGINPLHSTVDMGPMSDRVAYLADKLSGSSGIYTAQVLKAGTDAFNAVYTLNFDSLYPGFPAGENRTAFVFSSKPYLTHFPMWFVSAQFGNQVPKPGSNFDYSLQRYIIGDWLAYLFGGYAEPGGPSDLYQSDTPAAYAARNADFCRRIQVRCSVDFGQLVAYGTPVVLQNELTAMAGFDWTSHSGMVEYQPSASSEPGILTSNQVDQIEINTCQRVWLNVDPPVALLETLRSLDNVSYIGVSNQGNAGTVVFLLTGLDNVTRDVAIPLVSGYQTLVRNEVYTSVCLGALCIRDIRSSVVYETVTYQNETFVTVNNNNTTNSYYGGPYYYTNYSRVVVFANDFITKVTNAANDDTTTRVWLLQTLLLHETIAFAFVVSYAVFMKWGCGMKQGQVEGGSGICTFMIFTLTVVSIVTGITTLLL